MWLFPEYADWTPTGKQLYAWEDAFMLKNYYRFAFEKFDSDGNPTIQVNYNMQGKIGEIFVYSSEVDEMVKSDREAFERRHVSKFQELQTEIYLIVNDQDFQQSVRYGT